MKQLKKMQMAAVVLLLSHMAGAHADSVVTFNVPVSLSKLDPTVTAVRVQCTIAADASKTWSASSSLAGNQVLQPVAMQAFNGTISVPVNIPAAQVKDAHAWLCVLGLMAGGSYSVAGNSNSLPFAQMAPGGSFIAQGTF